MKVFKFGGASLKDAEGVRNVGSIIASQPAQNLLVVVSAMGKTTNMLEGVVWRFMAGDDYNVSINDVINYHHKIISELFADTSAVVDEINRHFDEIQRELSPARAADELYDQVVSKGELISSVIVHRYLLSQKVQSYWHDSRSSICTDDNFREGRVNWPETSARIVALRPILRN